VRAESIPWFIGTLLAIVIGVGGCGKFYWGKPGSTSEQFDRDSRQCAEDAARTSADRFDLGYRKCLTERGYVREQKTEQPGSGWHRGLE
jgi:hypothetical protein